MTVDGLQRSLTVALMLGFIPNTTQRDVKETSNLELATAWMEMRMDATHGRITADVT